jgi:hypothetical protein
MEKMDTHVAKMLDRGWQVVLQVAHAGEGRGLHSFAKRDTVTIACSKPGLFVMKKESVERPRNPNASRAFTPNKSLQETRLSSRWFIVQPFCACPLQRNPRY